MKINCMKQFQESTKELDLIKSQFKPIIDHVTEQLSTMYETDIKTLMEIWGTDTFKFNFEGVEIKWNRLS